MLKIIAMNSPFTDHLINTREYESLSNQNNELESYSPFSKNCGCSQESGENNIVNEEELDTDEINKATLLNEQYKTQYKWSEFLPQIVSAMGYDLLSTPLLFSTQNFTKLFAEWQLKNGFKSNLPGVFGLNNWTYFQKKIGLHNLSNVYNINLEEAIKNNKYYKSRLWNDKTENILRFLADQKITKYALPINDEYLAYAIAEAQSKYGLAIDGVLGPKTLERLNIPGITLKTTGSSGTASKPSKWLSLIQGTSPSYAKPLVYGLSAFKAIVDAIRTATKSGHFIYITGWMIELDFPLIPNDNQTTIKNLLQHAASQNVEIRVLIWQNPDYKQTLINAKKVIDSFPGAKMQIDGETGGSGAVEGALIELREMINKIPSPLDEKLKDFDAYNSILKYSNQKNEGSHHEKIIVVNGSEGLIGFCGGIDLNNNRIGGFNVCGNSKSKFCISDSDKSNPKFYEPYPIMKFDSFFPKPLEILHDVHCEVRNNAALQLLKRFSKRWLNYTIANPHVDNQLIGNALHSTSNANVKDENTVNVKIIHTYNQKNGPETDRSIFETVKIAINNAEKSIHIEDQYMLSIEIAGLLNRKLLSPEFKTGTVTFLTQDDSFAKDDIPIIKRMRKEFLDVLYKGLSKSDPRVKVLMLDPAAPFPAHHQVHSKLYIIDRELVIIGSANCSRRSMTNDSETAAVIFKNNEGDSSFVKRIEDRYDQNFPWKAYIPNNDVVDIDIKLLQELPGILINHPEIAVLLGGLTFSTPWIIPAFQSKLPELIRAIVDPNNLRAATVHELEEDSSNTYFSNHEAPYTSNEETSKQIIPNCETRTCWAILVLNRELNLQLQTENKIGSDTKNAILAFQQKYQLAQSGRIDAVTERILLERDSLNRSLGTNDYNDVVSVISAAKTKVEDWTSRAVNTKPKCILDSYRDPRKLTAFVLHQMAFKRKGRDSGKFSDPSAYLSTGAHFCILLDGRIIQLHPLSRMIWHGNCISPRSVAVEFEGNFPNIKGRWWKEKNTTFVNKDNPTPAQFDAGRFLARYLKIVLGIHNILAHRQSSDSRENDPGPDIWYNVGQWAVNNLGLQDGGPGFKCGSGNPILPEWRTWGQKSVPTNELEDAYSELEESHEMEEWESHDGGEWVSEFENPDWSKAMRLNRYYSSQLGWSSFQDRINDLILPYSGLSNVSLGEEDFARAVAGWQNNNGFSGKNADGILGPSTWAKMKSQIIAPSPLYTPAITAPIANTGNITATLGVLTINTSIPALVKCIPEYRFTTEDAIWLARFVEGEAGGQDNPDSHAVIWAMFNRFGLLRHKVSSWTSFAVFLQKYSTTLQPLLNSRGAAERVWKNHYDNPSKFPVVSSESVYPGTSIKKVQYKRHINLQKKSWEEFPEYVRKMVLNILTGSIPNPGIGIATDFDSTYVFMISARKKLGNSDKPTYDEWKAYTYNHAANKDVIWIGEKPQLNQQKNAFYILKYLQNVPPDAVQVVISPVKVNQEDFEFESPDEYIDDTEFDSQYENEGSNFFFESINTENAIQLNRKYGVTLGWATLYDKINDILLPYSGLESVSLSESAFSEALAKWQKAQGFNSSDCDGILGPKTWARMKQLLENTNSIQVSPSLPSGTPPAIENTFEFNRWHAEKILENMNAGFVGQSFQSKEQLEKISRGETVNLLNPNNHIIQALPIIHHIAESAKKEDYKEIIIGSFIRGADKKGACTGHCAGRCIDLNISSRSFESIAALQMVVRILGYLTNLPDKYKKSMGFGMPLQGQFFGHQDLTKYKGVSTTLLKNEELRKLVNQLGYVFPDNDNHLHIQFNWLSKSASNYETEVVYEEGESYENS